MRGVAIVVVLLAALGACDGDPYGETAPPDQADASPPVGASDVEVIPTALDYGTVPCGDELARLITIHNKGSVPIAYKVQLPEGTSFRLDGAQEGVVGPAANITRSVFVNPRTAGDNSTDLVVTAGSLVQSVHAIAKGSGASLEIAPSIVDFGDVRKENGAAPVDVLVKNTGTEAFSATSFMTSSSAFDVQWSAKPSAFTVPAGASATLKVALLTAGADDAAKLTATVKPIAMKLCGAAPTLAVSGRRVTAEVTVSPVDWGKQGCNTMPAAKGVVITNYANAPVTYSVNPAATSSFTILNEGPHAVSAALTPAQPQTATISVQPKLLGATAPLLDVKELLGVTLASTAPGVSGRRDVALHVETRGAIVTLTPTSLAFPFGASATKPFTVSNTGNESIYLSWALTRSPAGGTNPWSESPPGSVAAAATANGNVTFNGTAAPGLSTATLTPSQSFFFAVALCKPMPALSLSGQ